MPVLPQFDYTSRDYSSIREDLFDRATVTIPEWTARDPGDFGVLMVELLAYVGDVLHYYVDRAAQECFLRTAALRRSVLDIANMLDYVPIDSQAAHGTVTFTRAAGISGDIVIPKGTVLTTLPATASDQVVFFETDAVATLLSANSTVNVAITEGRTVVDEAIIISAGMPNMEASLYYTGVIHGTVQISVNEGALGSPVAWQEVDRLIDSSATENVYSTSTDENGVTIVRFGDGVNGRVPPKSVIITATYRYGVGSRGNVGAGLVVAMQNPITGIGKVTNSAPTSGGEDRESIDSMRISIPKSLRSQDRAVTLDDYASLALKVPGVSKANSYWTNAAPNNVEVYIAPTTPTAPPAELVDEVEAYIDERRVLGLTVNVHGPTYVPINVSLTVQVAANRVQSWVKLAVEQAVAEIFQFDRVDFAERMRIADVYQAVVGIDGVEYMTITIYSRTGSGMADVQLLYNEIAVAGTIAVTANGGIS
jgi:uncharacterized phage protein gp47/JayE